MKRYFRGTDLNSLGLGRSWQREIVKNVLWGTRSVWSLHGQTLQADLRTKKYLVHSAKSIYAPIPKVGTKSADAIFALVGTRQHIEIRKESLDSLLSGAASSYKVFSIVRNPWSRTFSAYRDKLLQSNRLGNLAILARYPSLSPSMNFADFVKWLGGREGSDERADRHWISQYLILSGALSSQDPGNFIGRFENFDQDVREIMQRMGLSVSDIPRRNFSTPSADFHSYRDAYSARTKSIIAERYSRDIEIFGYSF